MMPFFCWEKGLKQGLRCTKQFGQGCRKVYFFMHQGLLLMSCRILLERQKNVQVWDSIYEKAKE